MSSYFGRMNWQTGAGVPVGNYRTVPDVAAPADPETGALVVLNGTNQQYGGTSWSAPTWAGICALINQSRNAVGLPSLGLLGPHIYPLLGTSSFRDITSGSNGAESAGTGYDLCTGVGVPNITTLVQTLSTAPSVAAPPANQLLSAGQTATFTVSAAGAATLTYQWQREPAGSSTWTNLVNNSTDNGVTTPTLTVTGVTAAMNGDQFQCVVTNSTGSATSASATLFVGLGVTPLVVSTFAGEPLTAGSTDGTGSGALFYLPGGIALDPTTGNIIVADAGNETIRKVTPAGVVTTFAGTAGTAGSNNGTGTSATFNGPSNVAVDSSGNIYVADAGNEVIRKITTAGVVSTLAGHVGRSGSTNGTGTGARFNAPLGVAVDSSGNVYVADAGNDVIRKITSGGTVLTFAGTAGQSGSTDGTGANARFYLPTDVAVDGSGNVYVADNGNETIRKITSAGVVTTLAGVAGVSGSNDGPKLSAHFNGPSGVRVDSAGNVYVADTNNMVIREITTTGLVVTLAGTVDEIGSANGVGAAALFNMPANALPAANGNVYVLDSYNDTLRLGVPSAAPSIQTEPANVAVAPGQNAIFSVAATGNPAPAYQWQRLPAGSSTWTALSDGGAYSGSATASLTVTAATVAMNGDAFQCVISNAAGSVTTVPAAVLAVGTAPQITSASAATFTATQAGSFTVQATGTPAPVFSATGLPAWASLNAGTGALTGTPPNTAGSPFTISITASNGVAPAATQTFTLSVQWTVATWQATYFGANASNPSISGPTADPNDNGVPNLLEYAFGSNPLATTDHVLLPVVTPAIDPADGLPHLTLTATLDATASGITIFGQVSADLQTWNSGANDVQIVSDSTSGAVRTLTLRDATPVGAGQRYIRLMVTQP